MREKNVHPPAPAASTIGPCPTVIQISRTPRHWKFTQHLRTTQPLLIGLLFPFRTDFHLEGVKLTELTPTHLCDAAHCRIYSAMKCCLSVSRMSPSILIRLVKFLLKESEVSLQKQVSPGSSVG